LVVDEALRLLHKERSATEQAELEYVDEHFLVCADTHQVRADGLEPALNRLSLVWRVLAVAQASSGHNVIAVVFLLELAKLRRLVGELGELGLGWLRSRTVSYLGREGLLQGGQGVHLELLLKQRHRCLELEDGLWE